MLFPKSKKIIALILATTIMSIPARAYAMEDVPLDVQEACIKYGEQYDILPELLEAIIWHESRFTQYAQNKSCKGLMQINVNVQKNRMSKLGIEDIYDIDSNIAVGADLLAELFDSYEDVGIVLGLYHGEKNAIKNGRAGKLSTYTQDILDKSKEYEDMHHNLKVTQ